MYYCIKIDAADIQDAVNDTWRNRWMIDVFLFARVHSSSISILWSLCVIESLVFFKKTVMKYDYHNLVTGFQAKKNLKQLTYVLLNKVDMILSCINC